MNLDTFDLNLLRVFDAVMREGSITAASARLGLTQPAISNALKRMRSLCSDPLFVRSTRGMTPTPYAHMLAESVGQAMGVLRKALELDVSFDPQTSTRTFHLVMTDVAELIFLPQLIRHLGQIAPGVSVHSIQMPRERYRDVLERGEIDLALGQLPEMQRGFHQQHLFEEPLVCLMREDHPLSRRALTLHSFLSAGQVAVAPPALVDTLVKRALGKRAARRRIVLQVPHYMVVPMVIAESELIAVMPQSAAAAYAQGQRLKMVPIPFRIAPVLVRQFWHERSHHDPGHRWFRGVVASLFMQHRGRPA